MAQRPASSRLVRALKEPTLHFALLAALLFGVSAWLRSGDDDVIEIDGALIAARVAEIEAAQGTRLTAEERDRVRDAYVDEQILAREALALGLEDDPRITDILAQKMLHVLSADVIQPSEEALLAFYTANLDRYTPEALVTLDEVVIATTDPLPELLRDGLETGADPDQLGDDVPIRHDVLSGVTPSSLESVFGETTAQTIVAAEPGTWVGPHVTVRGQHWLRVTSRTEPEPVPLDAVRDLVRLDWIALQEEALLETRVAELRARYRVVIEPPPDER